MKLLSNVMLLTDILMIIFIIVNVCNVVIDKNKIKNNIVKKIITHTKWYVVALVFALCLFVLEITQLILRVSLGINYVAPVLLLLVLVGYICLIAYALGYYNTNKPNKD